MPKLTKKSHRYRFSPHLHLRCLYFRNRPCLKSQTSNYVVELHWWMMITIIRQHNFNDVLQVSIQFTMKYTSQLFRNNFEWCLPVLIYVSHPAMPPFLLWCGDMVERSFRHCFVNFSSRFHSTSNHSRWRLRTFIYILKFYFLNNDNNDKKHICRCFTSDQISTTFSIC